MPMPDWMDKNGDSLQRFTAAMVVLFTVSVIIWASYRITGGVVRMWVRQAVRDVLDERGILPP